MRVLLIGDIVGKAGRKAVATVLPGLRKELSIDYVIADADNVSGGFGLTKKNADELRVCGVDGFTLGNHVWDQKETYTMIEDDPQMARPENFPPGSPGSGHFYLDGSAGLLGVLHLQGRVFMDPIDCPFRVGERVVKEMREQTKAILIDMHAEATSEKQAIGRYLDGKVSAVIGTHTHVVTCDEQIFPGGTGYQTDAGMTGPHESVLGMKIPGSIAKLVEYKKLRFETATGDIQFNSTLVEIDSETGRCISIERVSRKLEEHLEG
jgi:2',3'-cyclic-nucleotide 2'-phosphodiesterase